MQNNTPRNAVRSWLKRALEMTGLKPTPFAQAAGVAPSTILRALDPERTEILTVRTIERLCAAHELPPPTSYGVGTNGQVSGFAEPEARLIDVDDVEELLQKDDLVPWELTSRTLELAGYLAGDVVIVDTTAQPRPGDVVCAQVYNNRQGTAETVFRIYEPPYLMTATVDPTVDRKPILIDGQNVAVMGTVVRLVRLRAS